MRRTGAHSVLSLLFCLFLFVAFTGSVTAQPSSSSIDAIIPPSLVVPAGNDVEQILFGVGVQIYSYNGAAWVLTNVSADLYDCKGNKVGHHFFLGQKDINGGQAIWETFSPSSLVTGKTLVSVSGTFPVSGDSINWLLVQETSHSGSWIMLGSTTYIQRLFTRAGLAPSYSSLNGSVFNSNYMALYKFSAYRT